MICPQCGYDMGNKNKCLRCGYTVKAPIPADERKQDGEGKREEKDEVKVIDPANVYVTHPYGYDGYEDDFGAGFGAFGSPFSSLFDDLFGDPISDLLGGLFGINMGRPQQRNQRRSEEPPKKRRKQGPVIELNKDQVEIVDENGDPVDEKTGKKKDKRSGQ